MTRLFQAGTATRDILHRRIFQRDEAAWLMRRCHADAGKWRLKPASCCAIVRVLVVFHGKPIPAGRRFATSRLRLRGKAHPG
jgi:hypothetical protein